MRNGPFWPTDDPVTAFYAGASYEYGMILGIVLCFVVLNITGALWLAFMFKFGCRGDRLLVKTYRQLHGTDHGMADSKPAG